jgi:hypothetical protein
VAFQRGLYICISHCWLPGGKLIMQKKLGLLSVLGQHKIIQPQNSFRDIQPEKNWYLILSMDTV